MDMDEVEKLRAALAEVAGVVRDLVKAEQARNPLPFGSPVDPLAATAEAMDRIARSVTASPKA